jgi:hypothetical protein
MFRRTLSFSTTALFIVLVVSACDITVFGERGSGNVITETRTVSGFDEIVLSGSGEVVVDINGTESLTIEAEDNIMPLLTTEVRDGRLELSTKSSISPTVTVIYTISAATLDGLSIGGSGDITAAGINAESFDAEISGSGQIEVTGTTDAIDLEISGSGRYAGANLVASIATVSVSGSGHALVNVTDTMDAEISGSGTVEYIGDPNVNSSISGSGDISQR